MKDILVKETQYSIPVKCNGPINFHKAFGSRYGMHTQLFTQEIHKSAVRTKRFKVVTRVARRQSKFQDGK